MALSLELIRQAADRVAASHQLEVVEIEFSGGSKHRVLRVFIEKNREERAKQAEAARIAGAGSGEGPAHTESQGVALDQFAWVTHEDCERFSRDFGTLLDVEDLVPGSEYTLEVSSPGLDRKLSSRADYKRFLHSLVKVQTIAPLLGNRHWQGRLIEVKADGIVVDLTAVRQRSGKKGKVAPETQEIAFSNIEKASLIPEL
jgi:ribosome maturation factor RimP